MIHNDPPDVCRDLSSLVREPAGVWGGCRRALPYTRFHDNAEVEKTNKQRGMAARKPEKRHKFRNVRSGLTVGASARGFLVTLGRVTVLLDREAAEELTCLLVDALEPRGPLDITGTGSN